MLMICMANWGMRYSDVVRVRFGHLFDNNGQFKESFSLPNGEKKTKTIVATMIDYIKTTANVDTTKQIDTSGAYTLSIDGSCYNNTFGYTSAAKANTITVEYRIKTQNGNYGSWTSAAISLNGNEYTATKTAAAK